MQELTGQQKKLFLNELKYTSSSKIQNLIGGYNSKF